MVVVAALVAAAVVTDLAVLAGRSSAPAPSLAVPAAVASVPASVPATVAARPRVATAAGPRPSAAWVALTSRRTGIPPRALEAYGTAVLRSATDAPGCRLTWPTLAAIGYVESRHGTSADGGLALDGRPSAPVIGPALTGQDGTARVVDTDHGALDGDPRLDRAVGPLQFLPSTWSRLGVDGDGDGVADPTDLDDAAATAAVYLCRSAGSLTDGPTWSRAVLSYNHSDEYVDDVRRAADVYAERSRS